MTANKGIDYGLGKTNIDLKNNIRYGVISQNEVLQAWCDSCEPVYPDDVDLDEDDCIEPAGYIYQGDGYVCECGDDGDIFVTKSLYYTYAQFCSPCAPGACYLMNPLDELDEGNKCYCLGHDWFESGKAPYKVYSVETNEEVA